MKAITIMLIMMTMETMRDMRNIMIMAHVGAWLSRPRRPRATVPAAGGALKGRAK